MHVDEVIAKIGEHMEKVFEEDQWPRYLIKTHGTRIKRKSTLRDAFLSETS